jgi:hypothetical protein
VNWAAEILTGVFLILVGLNIAVWGGYGITRLSQWLDDRAWEKYLGYRKETHTEGSSRTRGSREPD